MLLPVGILVLWAVPLGWAYWLAADRARLPCSKQSIDPLWGWFFVLIALLFLLASFSDVAPTAVGTMGGAVSVVGIVTIIILGYVEGALPFRDADGHLDDSRSRNWLSSKLKTALTWFGATLALAVIDSLGQTLYAVWQASDVSLSTLLGTLLGGFGGLVAAAAGGRRVAAYFSGKPGGTRIRPSLNHAATIAAVLLFTLTLTAINVVNHGIAWGFKHPYYVPGKLVTQPVPNIEDSVDRSRAEMAELNSSVRILGDGRPTVCFAAMMPMS